MKDWPTDPTFADGSPNPMCDGYYGDDPLTPAQEAALDAGREYREYEAEVWALAGRAANEGDIDRWHRDEDRLAESPGYCRCGAHVLGTPCYAQGDRGMEHLWIALAMQAEADDYRAAANAAFAFDPHVFRVELEAALVKALGEFQTKSARTAAAAERRARREALQARAAAVVDEPQFPASVSILTEDYFAEAPKATGEAQDVFPDEADPDLRLAATLLARGHDERTIERLTGYTVFEAESVPFRTADAIGRDKDDLTWLRRDFGPGAKGFGMNDAEVRRQWLLNARFRYADMLRQAIEKHRGRIGRAEAIQFPALKSEAQFARSVIARWEFIDALAREGIWKPTKEEVAALKRQYGRTYADGVEALARRRDAAERGLLDRFTHELA